MSAQLNAPIQRSPSIESTTNLPQANNMLPSDMLTTQMLPAGPFLPTTTQDSEVEYPTDFEPFENHYDGNNPFLKPFADTSLQQQFTDRETLNLPDGITWKSKTSKSAVIFKFYCPTNNGYSTVRKYEVLFFEFFIEVFRQVQRK